MYNRLLILIFLFFITQTFSQRQEKIDSLKKVLQTSKEDLNKFNTLNHLWSESINYSMEDSDRYASQMITLGKHLNIDSIISFGYERKAVGFAYQNSFDSSRVYFNKALKMYKANDNYKMMAGVQRNIGQDYNMMGNLDSAYYYYDTSEKNYNKAKDSSGLASIYNSKGILYLQKGYYNLALENAYKSSDILEQLNETVELNQNYMVIATIYSQMKDTVNAINYYNKLTAFFESQGLQRQLCSNLILVSRLEAPNSGTLAQAERNILKAIDIAKTIKDRSAEEEAMTNYAKVLYHKKAYQDAETVLKSIIASVNERKDYHDMSIVYSIMGKLLIAQNKNKEAVTYLEKANTASQQLNILNSQVEINKLLATAHQNLNDNAEALRYYKLHKTLNDSIYDSESQNRFNELQTIYETEKKENALIIQEEEIKSLNAQAINDRLTKTLYGIAMISLLIIAGLLYFGFRQRIKKNKIEREKQEEIYKQEIEFKKKELASQTLHLVQKNTFIQELKENLEKIKKSPELFKIEFRRLVMLLKKQSAEDKDWEVFKSYFSEVHNNFDHKIKAIANDITEKEMRLASFLRMNLSTKEIASMLNVLPDSVLKSKYRLKKKLALDKEDDLTQFLNSL